MHITTLEMIILLYTGLAMQFYDTILITISSSSAIVIHLCLEYKADFVKYLLYCAAIATFGYYVAANSCPITMMAVLNAHHF